MENEQQPKIVNHNEMHDCNVFMGDSYGGIFPLPGSQVTVTQNLGPQKKSTSVSGDVETKEQRKMRKEATITAILQYLDLEPQMLGYDNKHKRITNDRICQLLRRCLGVASIPPRDEYRSTIEQLWVLLMDERNQCRKEPGEPFFRQTVLNIIGYFVEKELISGTPQNIACAIFPGTDANTAKNISRGITSAVFPNHLDEVFNYYITKLLNGEF